MGENQNNSMKTATKFFSILPFYLALFICTSCGIFGDSDTPNPTIQVETTTATSVTSDYAVLGGMIGFDTEVSIRFRGICWGLSPQLDTTQNKKAGQEKGPYTVFASCLSPNTKYYFQAFAVSENGFIFFGEVKEFTTLQGAGPVSDVDGNIYQTVQINTQVWMKENLKTTRYRDGTSLKTGLSDSAWSHNTSEGAFAIYGNNPQNDQTYGKLYNWYAVADPRGLCPAGWHVPSDAEWTTLRQYLEKDRVDAGGQLKAVSALWASPNAGASNLSCFTALPGGYRYGFDAEYKDLGRVAKWWTSTPNGFTFAWYREVRYDLSGMGRLTFNYLQDGLSVRCIKD
jgi:uncharacterized protein (TIGR02145 family)